MAEVGKAYKKHLWLTGACEFPAQGEGDDVGEIFGAQADLLA